jgi:hypothetical protein
MQTNTQPEADAVAQALTDPATQDVNDQLDHEIDGVPPMGANSPSTDMLDEVPTHSDLDTYVPNDEESKLILTVNEAGTEFKKVHEKLTKLFDRIRPSVQALKDNVFRVRKGVSGRAVAIGEIAVSWEEYCHHTFGVSARRINQLLEIDDRNDDRIVIPPVKKVHLTHERLEAMLDAKYKEGVSAAAAGAGVEDESDTEVDDEPEAGAPEVVRQLEDVINNSPLPEYPKAAGDRAFEYFEQFKDEPETLGTEIASMLVELKLDLATIRRIFKIAEKDATETIADLCKVGEEK